MLIQTSSLRVRTWRTTLLKHRRTWGLGWGRNAGRCHWWRTILESMHGMMITVHLFLKKKAINRNRYYRETDISTLNTVNSCYFEIQGTLWNISRCPYFDISDLRNWGKQLIERPPITEWICNLTPKLEIYWKYCGKEEKLLQIFTLR